MATVKNQHTVGSAYNVIYSDICGVDFSSDSEGSKKRLAYAENMYRDYDGDGGALIESIPGFRKIFSSGERINGIFTFNDDDGLDYLVIHAGKNIYCGELAYFENVSAISPVCTAANRRSRAYKHGCALYVIDGVHIIKVTATSASHVGDDCEVQPYVPTTYINGEVYEQKNLLSRFFHENYMAGSARSLAYGSNGLTYEILDEEAKKCRVTGLTETVEELYIPATVKLGDIDYYVTEIADYAFFQNEDITQIAVANGVLRIGVNAFSYCTSLRYVFMKESVELIDSGAFSNCYSLGTVFLGSQLREIKDGAFTMCPELKKVYYGAGPSSFEKVINNDEINPEIVEYYQRYKLFCAFIPIYTPASQITSVIVGGVSESFHEITVDGKITGVRMLLLNESEVVGKEIKITGKISEAREEHAGKSGYLSSSMSAVYGAGIVDAISRCTVCECFDGRVFLSGNPSIPGVCFYSSSTADGESDPLYFGDHNYWRDGDGIFNTVALLATSDSLAVFISSAASGSGIFYHTPESTDEDLVPKIYPTSYSHLGLGVTSEAISFFDDPVFVSKMGVTALSKQDLTLGRRIETRSHGVDAMLLSEDISKIRLAIWGGYLAVAAGERIYLADSRSTYIDKTGALSYDWFLLSGIGTYTEDKHVFRYSSVAREGLSVHECSDMRVKDGDAVISAMDSEGESYYYITENGVKYEVAMTEEMTGGIFHPLTEICALHDLFIFGTECGDVCIFNNDMRGIAPKHIRKESDFDADEYRRVYGRRIHPSFYSFAGHSPRYALKTHYDNGGIPHLLKDTEKHSSTVKCRAFSGGKLTFEVGTDTSGYTEVCKFPSGAFSFSDFDFSALTFAPDDSFTVLLSEKEKGWVEKQITLWSNEFCSPIGIYNIAYRFKIRGKLKVSI